MSKSQREQRNTATNIIRNAKTVHIVGEDAEATHDLAPGLYVTVIWKRVTAAPTKEDA